MDGENSRRRNRTKKTGREYIRRKDEMEEEEDCKKR